MMETVSTVWGITETECSTCTITVPYTYPFVVYWQDVSILEIVETRIIVVDETAETTSTSTITAEEPTSVNTAMTTFSDEDAYTEFWSSQLVSLSFGEIQYIQTLNIGDDGTPTAIVTGTVPYKESFTVVTGTAVYPTGYLNFGFVAESLVVDACENVTELSSLALIPTRTSPGYTNPYDVPQTTFDEFVALLPSSVRDCDIETPFYGSAVYSMQAAHAVTTYETTTKKGVVVNDPRPDPEPDDKDSTTTKSPQGQKTTTITEDEPQDQKTTATIKDEPQDQETTTAVENESQDPKTTTVTAGKPPQDQKTTVTVTEDGRPTTSVSDTPPTASHSSIETEPGATTPTNNPANVQPDITSTSTMIVIAPAPESSNQGLSDSATGTPASLTAAAGGSSVTEDNSLVGVLLIGLQLLLV